MAEKGDAGFKPLKDYDYYQVWDQADATYNEQKGTLEICGVPVMETWQAEYMAELAQVVSEKRGRILEVGFGLGLSCSQVQKCGVDEHIIIEANKDVFRNLMEFKHNAPGKVIPVYGKWQEVFHLFAPESFDGILYDPIPLTVAELHTRQFDFLREAKGLLKKDGVFTYCNVTSWGNLMHDYRDAGELFEKTQIPELEKLGFHHCEYKVIKVRPEEGRKYVYDTLPVPRVRF